MFAIVSTTLLALAATAAAGPVESRAATDNALAARTSSISSLPGFSFNNWGGFQSMSNFDNFFGSSDFCGDSLQQTIVTETQVCQSVETVTVIQEQLSIMLEFAKRIILEQICEVEVQTIVLSQFSSRVSSFSDDLSHRSGRTIGYDRSIASHINNLVNSDGSIVTSDYGFSGTDIGQQTQFVGGSNWVDGLSMGSVQQALLASQVATASSHSTFTSGTTFGSGGNSFSSGSSLFDVGGL